MDRVNRFILPLTGIKATFHFWNFSINFYKASSNLGSIIVNGTPTGTGTHIVLVLSGTNGCNWEKAIMARRWNLNTQSAGEMLPKIF